MPYTITATFAGFGQKVLVVGQSSFVVGDDCGNSLGNGAVVAVSAPGGADENSGPIEKAFVLNGGNGCYARPGRVPPSLSITSGSKAEFAITLEEFTRNCLPVWKVSGITVKNGGDIADGTLVYPAESFGDTLEVQAIGKVSQSGESTTVSVVQAGRYYRGTHDTRDIPIIKPSAGFGVRLSADIGFNGDTPPTWSVRSLSILHPGEGIDSETLGITFTAGDRTEVVGGATAEGHIIAEGGKATSVVLTNGGSYYRNTDVPPIVRDLLFKLGGSAGGTVRGVVDDDPSSKTFGKVIDTEVEDPGSSYLGWRFQDDLLGCMDLLNGKSVVMRAAVTTPLVRMCVKSCFGSGAVVEPIVRKKPVLLATAPSGGTATVYLERTPGAEYPATWRVRRVQSFQYGFAVGEALAISFPGSITFFSDPNGRYFSPTFQDRETISGLMRAVEEEPAVIVVSEIDELSFAPGVGYLKAVTISNPGKYYLESNEWDGVPTPLHHARIAPFSRGAGYAKLGRAEPVVVAGVAGEMSVSLSESTGGCGLPVWEVESIEPGGSKYTDGTALPISTSDKTETTALVVVHTRLEPAITATVPGGSASLSVSLKKTGPTVAGWGTSQPSGVVAAVWSVDGITVNSAGSGYPPNSSIPVTLTTPHAGSGAAAVAATDAAGAIAAVAVTSPGAYYRDNGEPQEFTIVRAGAYYREDEELEPYVGLEEISIVQTDPSNGSGAVVKATVNTDTSSEFFGRLESVEVESAGSGYLLRSGPTPAGGSCSYQFACQDTGSGYFKAQIQDGRLEVYGIGSSTSDSPYVSGVSTGIMLRVDDIVACDAGVEGTYKSPYAPGLGEIAISRGGEYNPSGQCCYCLCNALGTFDLNDTGLQSIIVDFDIDVDPDSPFAESCASTSGTLTLEQFYLSESGSASVWTSRDFGSPWDFGAQLDCAGQYSLSFGASCINGGVSISGVVAIESELDTTDRRCKITGGGEGTFSIAGATATISVTAVLAGEGE